jgi:hypothetical protein
MGTAIVVFHKAGNRSLERESMPVTRLPETRTEVITTGAASVATTLAAIKDSGASNYDGGFVTIFAVGANLWVTSGLAPVAAKPAAGASGSGHPIISGQSQTFAVAHNEKIAAIEWA